MKTLIFWILKLLEIAGVVAIYFLLCALGHFVFGNVKGFEDSHWYNVIFFILSFACSIGIIAIFLMVMLLREDIVDLFDKWIYLNKKWASRIWQR
jgi:hypothetical protein